MAEGGSNGTATKRVSNADIKRSYEVINAKLDAITAMIDDIQTAASVPETPEEQEQQPSEDRFVTSREQFETYKKMVERRDAEFADKQFMSLLEHICSMREDYRHLIANMEKNITSMTGAEVLSSFKGYLVDMDNMLKDAGVRYGSFETPNHAVDTNLQRIVGVVSTWDQAKDGTVAERLSSGYEYKGRAVVKEKVRIYRATDSMETS